MHPLYPDILAENVFVGVNTVIEPGVSIRGIDGKARDIIIGDNVYIGKNVQIICNDFKIGDYSKIQHDTNIHGYRHCHIGHNAWIGQFAIIDCIGGTTIGNNCGIGAHSQLWSHIKYGDTLEGCRFKEERPLLIGNDVWFVGHCIVSPIKAEDKSMALVGSVVTGDMKFNTIYAGTPAKPVSEKIGPQFIERTVDEKLRMMQKLLKESGLEQQKIKIVGDITGVNFEDDITYFNVAERRYSKKRTAVEIAFMKFLLPDKAKFTPYE
ncbi:MAG TPA: DapH/DapD/GlmU-related protein [Panacibacter sp.]|nr:DapH/DapD/GlmU-related protein [Panacibacter sp.]HNP46582.1 DapH/DapD/GlmU-related protein [Panacibacter sp.]